MNNIGILILSAVILISIIELISGFLNIINLKKGIYNKDESIFRIYDEENITKSLNYMTDSYKLEIASKFIDISVILYLFLSGHIQQFVSYINISLSSEFLKTIIFFFTYSTALYLINMPFDIYDKFVIEKKYGFNNTTLALYIRDIIVASIISTVIYSAIFYILIFIIENTGIFWFIPAGVSIFVVFLTITYLYPILIAPLFNKFSSLEEGSLSDKINLIANKANFPIEKILTMDASKRSSHTNAYFTGIGTKKRIVLFDTLIKNHSEDEITAVLAHEIGHSKLGHIKKSIIISFFSINAIFAIIGYLINTDFIYNAFGFEKALFSGIFAASILLSPIMFLLSPITSFISRKHEFQADHFALGILGNRQILTDTLTKLYKDNLSNPLPHRFSVLLYYSHPPLLQRLDAINNTKL